MDDGRGGRTIRACPSFGKEGRGKLVERPVHLLELLALLQFPPQDLLNRFHDWNESWQWLTVAPNVYNQIDDCPAPFRKRAPRVTETECPLNLRDGDFLNSTTSQ